MKGFYVFLFLFVCMDLMAIKPFYNFGIYNKSVETLREEVERDLVEEGFDVIGVYNPGYSDSLSVVVFTCDELTSLATGISNKSSFGSTMKIGLIGEGERTKITMLNPFYFVAAYFQGNANEDAIRFVTNRVDSLAKRALSGFSKFPIEYGIDVACEELRNYHFLPTMARFDDFVQLKEFSDYADAVRIVKSNLIKKVEGSEMVYELNFRDKEVALFGVSFGQNRKVENELLNFLGVNYLSSLPIEILVQDNKVFILNPKYRIPVFKPEVSIKKYFKLSGLSSEIKNLANEIVSN